MRISNRSKLIVALLLHNIVDYFFTLEAIGAGGSELNSIMDLTIGTVWFPIIKLGLVPLALLSISRIKFNGGNV